MQFQYGKKQDIVLVLDLLLLNQRFVSSCEGEPIPETGEVVQLNQQFRTGRLSDMWAGF